MPSKNIRFKERDALQKPIPTSRTKYKQNDIKKQHELWTERNYILKPYSYM